MSQSAVAFIAGLTNDRRFGPGERARLRALAGRGLDENTPGFDLFTGLWWPLRQKNKAAPRREVAWLVAKLYAASSIRHVPCETGRPTTLAAILGREERRLSDRACPRFRQRFDELLQTPLSALEPHLRWALSVVRDAAIANRSPGIDWERLTDDLSIWDRGEDVRDTWAKHYVDATQCREKGDRNEERDLHADRDPHDPESQPIEPQPR
jgi:CRISPR type I-E-associated protein CasB/Cse2